MKTNIIGFLVIYILFGTSIVDAKVIINKGVKAGINRSNVYTYTECINDSEDKSPVLKTLFGVYCQIDIFDFFVIQPEIYFNSKGYKFTDHSEISRIRKW